MDLGENSKVFTIQKLNNGQESDFKQLEIEESICNIRKKEPFIDNPTEFPNKVSSFISSYVHIKFCSICTRCELNKHFSLVNPH